MTLELEVQFNWSLKQFNFVLLAKKDIIQCEEANYILTTKNVEEYMPFRHSE